MGNAVENSRGGDYFAENFDFNEELQAAFARAEEFLSGVKLTNLEKIDIRRKLEYIRDLKAKTPQNPDNWFSPGFNAAFWFLRDNYDYNPANDEQGEFRDWVELGLYKAGRPMTQNIERHFQKRQDDTHKP